MFEAAECHGWLINNNIHRLDVVVKNKTKARKQSGRNETCLYPPQTQPKVKGGNSWDQRNGEEEGRQSLDMVR